MVSTDSIPRIGRFANQNLRVVLAGMDFKGHEVLINLLRQKGLEPIPSSSLKETKWLLAQKDIALAICHASSSDGAFRDLLGAAVRGGIKVPVIICADFYDPHLYLEAMELGAFDYFTYPYYHDGVEWVVGNAIRQAMNPGHNPHDA